jgi:Flp pilus assembly protein TadD
MNRKLRRMQGKTKPAKPPTAPVDVQQALAKALAEHQAGRFAQAEQGYRRILALEPGQPDALHLLGLVAHQGGRKDLAADLIGQAIGIDGSVAAYHSNLGAVLKDLGRLDEAAAACGVAIRQRKESGMAEKWSREFSTGSSMWCRF